MAISAKGVTSIKFGARRVLGGKLKKRPPNAVATRLASDTGLAGFHAGASLLRVHDLRTNILKPNSFSLSAGEAVAVRGPSGAGETLLLRAIADLYPNEGLVTLDGPPRELRRRYWRHEKRLDVLRP